MDATVHPLRELPARSAPEAAEPVISVIIPAHSRPRRLTSCLEAISRQSFPRDLFEVIVCDDGSPVPLAEQLAPVLPELAERMTVTLVRQPQAGPAAARNRAASLARGRFIAFTDDDCAPASDWLAVLVSHLEAAPGALVGGGLRNSVPENLCSTATQLITDSSYQYQSRRPNRGIRFYSTSNLAMSAEGFRQIGGFSEAFRLPAGEDYDFSARWQHHGWPTAYVPEACVNHFHVLSFRKFAKQHINYGRGLFRVRQMMARRSGGPMRVSEAGFYFALVAYAFQQKAGARSLICAVLIMLSQVATLAGASYEAIVVGGAAPRDPDPLPSRNVKQ